MVMIEGANAVGLADLGYLAEDFHVLLELLPAGAVLLGKVGDGDVFYAYLLILAHNALHIPFKLLEGHMGGHGLQAGVLNGGLYLGGGHAISSGQLHAVIAHFLHFAHGAGEILLGVLPDGIDLHGNGQLVHGKNLLDYKKYSWTNSGDYGIILT